jgi:hypothetical protein
MKAMVRAARAMAMETKRAIVSKRVMASNNDYKMMVTETTNDNNHNENGNDNNYDNDNAGDNDKDSNEEKKNTVWRRQLAAVGEDNGGSGGGS